MTLEEAIAAAHAKGLSVNNLFERTPAGTGWQANVKRGNVHFYEFGLGARPADALMEAVRKAPDFSAQEPDDMEGLLG